MGLRDLTDELEDLAVLDGLSGRLAGAVNSAVAPAKSLLSGTWLDHPLHLVLTDVPLGFWSGAVILDLFGGSASEAAVQPLVELGVLAALPRWSPGSAIRPTSTARSGGWAWSTPRPMSPASASSRPPWAPASGPAAAPPRARGGRRRWLPGRAPHLRARARSRPPGLAGEAHRVDRRPRRGPPGGGDPHPRPGRRSPGAPLPPRLPDLRPLRRRPHASGPLHEGTVDDDLCVTCPGTAAASGSATGSRCMARLRPPRSPTRPASSTASCRCGWPPEAARRLGAARPDAGDPIDASGG